MDQHQFYIDKYKVIGELGFGGQATVYLCCKNKELLAAKVYAYGMENINAFKKEVEFLSKLNFKHLINIVSSNIEAKIKISSKQETIRPAIFLQYAQRGDLFDFVAKAGGRLQPEICRNIIKMLLEAIEYLNSIGIAHRDLKPENILFDKNFILKVSDFGLATFSEGKEKDGILYSKIGTSGYKSPEMELGKYTGVQADLFAVGVILFIMYTGTFPFGNTQYTDKIYRLIRQKNFKKFWELHEKKSPGIFPDSFKRLLNSFFSVQLEKRPTLQNLKKDQWLNGNQLDQVEFSFEMNTLYEKTLAGNKEKQKIMRLILQIQKFSTEQSIIKPEGNETYSMKAHQQN